MADHEEQRRAREAILSAARAVVDGDLGVLDGARVIAAQAFLFDPEQDDADLPGIVGIESQTDHLLLGEHRWAWHPSALEERAAEVVAAEAFFAPSMRALCQSLLDRHRAAS